MTTTAEKRKRREARTARRREEAELQDDPARPGIEARRQTLVLDAKARGTWSPALERKLVPLWERVDAERVERRKRASRAEREAALERGLGLERRDGVVVSRAGLDGPTDERAALTVEGEAAVDPPAGGRPARALDILDAWERQGAIGRPAADAARRFREDFQLGGLLALKAVDPNAVGGGGIKDLPGGIEERRRALRIIDRLGGMTSPAGMAFWHVLGCEATLEEAARRMPGPIAWDRDMIRAAALAGIGMLGAR
ncbi:MAG: hypothetical protein WD341_06140 [Tistlia sp.]|uniref:hypothetical protein n=1 Tax=Tistlia sp. TaxID=3057121 RepID=UPI0034A41854